MSIGRIRRKPYRKVCLMQVSCRAFSVSYSFMFESTKQKGRRSLILSKQ